MDLQSSPINTPLSGRYRPPGDKSISHRLALLAAMAPGKSHIEGFLDSQDTVATARAMEAMGAVIEWTKTPQGYSLVIEGGRWKAPSKPLDFGNSGTGMRLGAGLIAGLGKVTGLADHPIVLIGDASLSKRPMQRIVDPLLAKGADIRATHGHAPLTVHPKSLSGSKHSLTIASAQIKSALLLAGLSASGQTHVIEPSPSRDHTERMLEAFGVQVERISPTETVLVGGQTVQPGRHQVPGDISSAAFIMAAALLMPGSEVHIDQVGLNPTRDGILRIISAMRGQVAASESRQSKGEPMGEVHVTGSQLSGLEIPPEWVPLAIDEFPMVMGMAALANGETRITDASELRVKESDRLALMCRGLSQLGVEVEEYPDGARIVGGALQGGVVECEGDHRIAMTFAVLGLVANSPIIIRDAQWIQTSYPGFVDDLNALGGQLTWLSS